MLESSISLKILSSPVSKHFNRESVVMSEVTVLESVRKIDLVCLDESLLNNGDVISEFPDSCVVLIDTSSSKLKLTPDWNLTPSVAIESSSSLSPSTSHGMLDIFCSSLMASSSDGVIIRISTSSHVDCDASFTASGKLIQRRHHVFRKPPKLPDKLQNHVQRVCVVLQKWLATLRSPISLLLREIQVGRLSLCN